MPWWTNLGPDDDEDGDDNDGNFDCVYDEDKVQGVPKKIVQSNFLTLGHDIWTGSSNFGSQHLFQNLQAKALGKGVYLKAFSKNHKNLKTIKIGASASARKYSSRLSHYDMGEHSQSLRCFKWHTLFVCRRLLVMME